MMLLHYPVMLAQSLSALHLQPEGIYIDATFGRGGHSRAILEQLGPKGRLFAFDQDPEAFLFSQQIVDSRFKCFHARFDEIKQKIDNEELTGKISGVLFDLGVSSPQLDNAERGFSFMKDGPLDMRMNPQKGHPASYYVARLSEKELADIFFHYGEERYSRRLAKAVVMHRKAHPFLTTKALAAVISEAHPHWEKGKNPATRCFQALRIYVNQECEVLQAGLKAAAEVLCNHGMLVAISFHSLEDRIIKQTLATYKNQTPFALKSHGKVHLPLDEELRQNSRSRSAKMRIAEKIVV